MSWSFAVIYSSHDDAPHAMDSMQSVHMKPTKTIIPNEKHTINYDTL